MKNVSVSLEDGIMTREGVTAAGSKILHNFAAPFDAAVVTRLRNAGVTVSGKVCMREFGNIGLMEDDGLISCAVRKLLDGEADVCLCNDLFGRYRREAAQNGLFYIQPTYGTVSRFGLIPLATSMDQIGVLCRDLAGGFKVLETIAGKDAGDGAMFPEEKYTYARGGASGGKPVIRVPSNALVLADYETQSALRDFSALFADNIDRSPLEYFEVYKQTMYLLTCAEISNNISRYDGVKFGYRSADADDLERLYVNTRTEGFKPDTRLAAMMGALVLSDGKYLPYYEKAMKIRRLVKQSLNFDGYDLIALPAVIADTTYDNLPLYALTALAGLPSVAFNFKGRGLVLVADVKREGLLLERGVV